MINFVFKCECTWSGKELSFSRLGQGFCPQCGYFFKWAYKSFVFEKLVRGEEVSEEGDLVKFLDALRAASVIEDDKIRTEEIALAIGRHLPVCAFHRIDFAKEAAGMSYDATTASLGHLSFRFLQEKALEEEKYLFKMIQNLID